MSNTSDLHSIFQSAFHFIYLISIVELVSAVSKDKVRLTEPWKATVAL